MAVRDFAYFQVYDYDLFWNTDANNVLAGGYAGTLVSAAWAWHVWQTQGLGLRYPNPKYATCMLPCMASISHDSVHLSRAAVPLEAATRRDD